MSGAASGSARRSALICIAASVTAVFRNPKTTLRSERCSVSRDGRSFVPSWDVQPEDPFLALVGPTEGQHSCEWVNMRVECATQRRVQAGGVGESHAWGGIVRVLGGELVLSPSDLTGFAACAHLTQLELAAARGEVERPDRNDPLLDVLTRRGAEHEQTHLAAQQAEAGLRVVTVSDVTKSRADLEGRAAETVAAMCEGVDVIYQAVFFDGRWAGYADFVERVEYPSGLGGWSYEVSDTKLARSVKAAAVLQCCAYTEYVARIQGREPEHLHVLTGDGARHTFRVADFSAYYRRLKADFEALVLRDDGSGTSTPPITYPDPVQHCSICRWAALCAQRRRVDDHLSLVAGMGRHQTRRLVEAGIATGRALAASDADDRPPRMAEVTFERLHDQAALQAKGAGRTPPLVELLPVVRPGDGENDEVQGPGPRGFAALPTPSPGDLFLDLEGDPFVGGGLEYLFGVVEVVDGEARYRSFWGHDGKEEKAALGAVIDLIVERRAQYPGMHVYHYASYEQTAIRRLIGAHATRETEVDDLLTGEVFVDLYQVVRHALRLSTESYSLKQVEKLYLQRPPSVVMDAGSSIVAYEQWLLDGEQQQLDEIEAYNKDDCDSTYLLREWLEARRAEIEASEGPIPRPVPRQRDRTDLKERLDAVDELTAELVADVPDDLDARTEEQQARWLLGQLLHWHRREENPAWWRFFDRCRPDRTEDDVVDDAECIGGLVYEGVVEQVKLSLVHRYRFVPQEHRFKTDDYPVDPATRDSAGVVVRVGDDFIDLKRGVRSDKPHPRALIPGGPIDTDDQEAALVEVGTWVRDHGIDAPGQYRAARDLLLGRGPRLMSTDGEPLVARGERPLDAACRLVTELDGGCLAIQGPPGAGKTYTGAHMILELLEHGQRVGITAQSHAVISNFLAALDDEAKNNKVVVAAIQKADDDQHCGIDGVSRAGKNAQVLAILDAGDTRLAAGTSWLWCDPMMRESVDVLFVDEAGQRSLADVVAASVAARNVVLLGDPQQLAHVSQGSHPDGAEESALAHLLGEHATMPSDLGLFLDTTYRMHPAVCEFISTVVYENKLESEPGLERQVVDGDGLLAGAGLRFVPVEHEGNTTSSPEEAEVVAQLVHDVLGRFWTDEDSEQHKLALEHVLVVAPYNAQVAELHRHLPDGARVGTVDKFQGQAAPVTIYSTASSSADDAPRGMDFLYDLHRLNVAVSRARSISIIVCSPQLQEVLCATPKQMLLANAVCRFVEMAERVAEGSP
jgi:predicted RecB family nuclease